MPRPEKPFETTRLNLALAISNMELLLGLQRRRGYSSLTETIQVALAVFDALDKAKLSGKPLGYCDDNGSFKELMIIIP